MLRLAAPLTALAIALLAAPSFAAQPPPAAAHPFEPPDPCLQLHRHSHAYLRCRRLHPLNEGWEQDKLMHQQTGKGRY